MKVLLVATFTALLGIWATELATAQKGVKVEWGPWGNWTKCSVTCGAGEMRRERRCTTPGIKTKRCLRVRRKRCSARPCPTTTMIFSVTKPTLEVMATTASTIKITSDNRLSTEDYTMAPWGEWSVCEVQCGGGMRYRTRECEYPDGKSGCEEAEGQRCNTHSCIGPMPTGEQAATPDTDVKPEPVAMPEPTPAPEEMPKTTPEGTDSLDYTMAPWGDWSSCEAECGGGMRYRTRECEYPDRKSGCEEADGQMCNTHSCIGPMPTGEQAATPDTDVKPEPEAMPEPTPTPEGMPKTKLERSESMDYTLEPWGEWSPCEAQCGGGMRYRTRECEEPNGRPECEEADGQVCNTHSCIGPMPTGEPFATPVTAETPGPDPMPRTPGKSMYMPWSQWTPCSFSCGRGKRYRIRECEKKSGEPECEDSESEDCNTRTCQKKPTAEPVPTAEWISSTPLHSIAPKTLSIKTSAETMSDKQKRRKAKEMKRLCGKPRIKASIHVSKTAISPGFPSNYTSGIDCTWTLIAPRNTRIKLIIDDFQTSECCDRITLLEGRAKETKYRDARIATLTGSIEPGTKYISIGRYMTVRLQSGKNSPGGKYRMRYVATNGNYQEDDDRKNSESAPDEELWWKILHLVLKWVYIEKSERM